MKKYNWLKFLAVGLLLTPLNQSCTDLDEELFDSVTEDNFFKTDEEFISALGAAYVSLQGYGGNGNIYSLQEVTSDEMAVPTRGNDWDDGGHWRRLHTHQYNSEDPIINGGWDFGFGGVNACNRLIFQFENLEIDGKEAFISELKVLRALFYYWLLDMYGNVPIVTRFDVPADFQPANNTRQEVYSFVEKEILDNLAGLSKNVDGSTYARTNYYVAQMTLANLYLNSEVYTGKAEYAKAVAAADEVINSGKYRLAANFFDNFKTDNAGSPEFIFAIPYDEVFLKGFNLPMMTLHYLSQETFDLTAQPWNGFCSLQEFYESFEDTDIRKASLLAGPQFDEGGARLIDNGAEANDPDGPPLTFTPEINELNPKALRQAGARVGKFQYALGATPDLSNDFPIYRFAEALLIKAEALWRQNPGDANALTLVNQIRQRAGVAPFTSLTADNLLAERGREFFSEVKRRSDLIRFGRYNQAWWAKPASPAHVTIFPIPRAKLDANKNLRQNPGY